MATIKQKLVASKLVENGGNMGQAMIKAGYSPATAKTPQKLTTSKGWISLMKDSLPDTDLLKTHRGLLKSYKLEICQFPKEESDEVIKKIIGMIPGWRIITIEKTSKNKMCVMAVPDSNTRKGALELAYKVTNRLDPPTSPYGGEAEETIDEAIEYIRRILPRPAG